MMKVYPTLVVRGTALARLFELGRYRPYGLETTVDLLAAMKKYVPRWHRIMRIQREIPAADIIAGVKNGNLRELVREMAAKKGISCACIRCREVALSSPRDHAPDRLVFSSEEYAASGGTEVFASYEYERSKRIAGFVRMRWPSDEAGREEVRGSCIVRELKVYGRVVAVGDRDSGAWQHRGLGASMLNEMEVTARERFGARRLLVTSAVGTRNYYRRFGFERLGPYMSKRLE
jgi:elongator complex protein 3